MKRSITAGVCILVFAFSAFLLGGCVTAKQKLIDQGLKPMNDQDFQEFFKNPVEASYYSLKRNKSMKVHYSPDGTQKLIADNVSDVGKYTYANSMQCSKWENIRNGQESCSVWIKVADNTYEIFDPNGSKSGTLTVK